ncbi:polysaccharide pyruvyl transferase family protein [Sulfuriferula thiophila]|uniref:polysaccharide pyruvyl transferase family protein n=1 Tax=Sulfuriferula thiophila TaxID=1781211 RepID=UPI000F607B5A|nr:polysaccharide pyruvyl transferase family protein [Sulfuriferula thiophila]
MKKLKIGFAWQTLTSENLGVAALAQSQIALAKEAANTAGYELEAIEFCPTGPKLGLAKELGCELADPLSIKKIILGKSRYVGQMRSCDLVLDIGAGDSFSDIYGQKHFFFLCLSKLIALGLKKPLILSPQTIGPFSASWVKKLAVFIMHRSKKVFARDGMSMKTLVDMGVVNNTEEVIDVAFCLPYEKKVLSGQNKTRVGINVSGLLMNGGYTRDNQFGLSVEYQSLINQVIEYFLTQPDVEIHLVGHVLADTMPVEDDYIANMALHAKYPSLVVAPKFNSPSEAKSYISSLDFFTGARMHACIAAFSSGVPVIPMAYSRKFNGLFGALGYWHLADLKTDDTENALSKIINGYNNRSNLKTEVDSGNIIAQEKLSHYKNYLISLFRTMETK